MLMEDHEDLRLRIRTSQQWLDTVLSDFDAFLLDHAANERKASATAMKFVVRYPNKHGLVEAMIQLAREELTHFHRVYRITAARGLTFTSDTKDPYVNGIAKAMLRGGDKELLDRLLIAAIVEARGCERFAILANSLQDPTLQAFYEELATSEARHRGLFVDVARDIFPEDIISPRLETLLDHEASVVENLPLRPAVH